MEYSAGGILGVTFQDDRNLRIFDGDTSSSLHDEKCHKPSECRQEAINFSTGSIPVPDPNPRTDPFVAITQRFPVPSQNFPLELYSVIIKTPKGRRQPHLVGDFAFYDKWGELVLNLDKVDSEAISSTKRSYLLSGLYRSIMLCDFLILSVCLKDKNRRGDDAIWYEGTQLIVGSNRMSDERLSMKFVGRDGGSATLYYIALSRTVEAYVEVTLLPNSHGDGEANLHGYIRAESRCGSRRSSSFVSVLFQNKREVKHAAVDYGEVIPLLRYVVSVKRGFTLTVEANLFDCKKGFHSSSSEDDEIAKGSVHFAARASGNSAKSISGIKVEVTWATLA